MLLRRFLTLLVVFASAHSIVHAQSASYTVSGTGCTTGRITSSIGPVPLAANGLPVLGSSFQIVTESTATYPWGNRRIVTLATGLSNTSIGSIPLPIDVAALAPGEPYCGLLQTSSELLLSVPATGNHQTPASITLSIPNLPVFAGVAFYQQVISIEASSFGPPFRSLALSPLGTGVMGF